MTEHNIIQPLDSREDDGPPPKAQVETRTGTNGGNFTAEPVKKTEVRMASESQVMIRHYVDKRKSYWDKWILVSLLAGFVLILSHLPITGMLFMVLRPFILLAWGLYGLYCGYNYGWSSLMLSGQDKGRKNTAIALAYLLGGLIIFVSIVLIALGFRALDPTVFWQTQGFGL